jgi:hypothetical protein
VARVLGSERRIGNHVASWGVEKFVRVGARVRNTRRFEMITEINQVSTDEQRRSDLEFASRAVAYLEKKGLGFEEVIEYLMEEFDLDLDTARALAAVAA